MLLALLLLCAGAMPAGASDPAPGAANAGAAVSDTVTAGGEDVRGTERPLPHRATLLQKTGRAVLFVPYAAVSAAAWPVKQVAYVEERYHPLGALASLLSFQRRRENVILRGSFGFESSMGVAVAGASVIAADWMGTGVRLKLNGGYLDRHRNQAALTLRTPAAAAQGEILARYDNRDDRHFYGLGPHSPDDDSEFERERRLLEGTVRVQPAGGVTAALTGYLKGADLTSTDDAEGVSLMFPEAYDRAGATRYRGVEAVLSLDRRDAAELSIAGQLLRLAGGTNEARSAGDADYRHYAVEAQAFFNLFHRDRILAVRAQAQGVDASDPERIPFTELPALGGKHGLRGYARNRFVDRTALLLTAEYRYPVTTLFSGRLVFEWGSVAPEWERMRLADIDPVVGLAIVTNTPDWPLTVQLAGGSEGLELYVGTESVFTAESRRLR